MTQPPVVWYCTHCARERPEQPGFHQIDVRYTVVLCRTGRERDSKGEPLAIEIPRHRLALDPSGAPLGHPYPGVQNRIEAVAMVKARRQTKNRQRELRVTQLGDDYWSNKTKRHQLQPPPAPPKPRRQAESNR